MSKTIESIRAAGGEVALAIVLVNKTTRNEIDDVPLRGLVRASLSEVSIVHWSDVMAKRLAERGDKHIVATGITPSGEFHIGHLREILTGDMIACRTPCGHGCRTCLRHRQR